MESQNIYCLLWDTLLMQKMGKIFFKKIEPCSRTTITTECRDKNSPASKGTAANFNQGCWLSAAQSKFCWLFKVQCSEIKPSVTRTKVWPAWEEALTINKGCGTSFSSPVRKFEVLDKASGKEICDVSVRLSVDLRLACFAQTLLQAKKCLYCSS